MSNPQPLPDVTPSVQSTKPATTVERLVRIETLLLLAFHRLTVVAWLVVAVLVLCAFVLGHVWR